MREILFRAKVKFERLISAKPNEKKEQVVKWVYWGVYGQTVDEIGNAFPYNVDGLRVVYIDTARRFIIPETLGQYTGLTDKNSEKIFEGDIVDVNIKGNHTICKVVWADNVAQFQLWQKNTVPNTPTNLNLGNYDCEKVGNIHDNPELMEAENDKL